MDMERTAVALAVVACVAIGAAGCGSSDDGTSDGTSTATAAQTSTGALIGESSAVASNANVRALTYGAESVAKDMGFQYKMLDANLSSDKQVTDIDTLVSLGAKGIVTLTLDPGAADAAYKRAFDRGIPIVGFNSTSKYIQTEIAQETDTSCVPGDDAAKFIAERIPGAEVLVVGGPPVPSIRLRTNCFTKAAKANGLEVAQTQYNVNDTAAAAQPIVQNMLASHPDAQAIFAFNDPSALGAGAVLRAAGKQVWSGTQKGIIVTGINGTADAAAAIKAGIITATYDANSPQAGAAAVSVLSLRLKDKRPLDALPKKVVIETTRWDSSNIAQYVDPLKRTVGPVDVAEAAVK